MSTQQDYEDRILSSPLAETISGEDTEHEPTDGKYLVVEGLLLCGCERCRIIRVKRAQLVRFLKEHENDSPVCQVIICTLSNGRVVRKQFNNRETAQREADKWLKRNENRKRFTVEIQSL